MKLLPIILILIVMISGCVVVDSVLQNITFQPKDDSEATEVGVEEVVNSNNQFAIDMYSQLKSGDGNVFFSPYSISTAFSIAYEGAREETAKEIASVFYLPDDDVVRRSSFASLYNKINRPSSEYQLNTVNAFWGHEDYPFLEKYTDMIEKYYGAEINNLDFVGESEKSRVTINEWVEGQTKNKIKDLIPAGVLDPDTRFVITNAIYFKGFWANKFDKSDTKDEDFRLVSGETVKVPTMKLEDDDIDFNYMETDEVQVLEMDYRGQDVSMIILLPKNDIEELEDSLDSSKLEMWRNSFSPRSVYIYLPKFGFETKYFLGENLKEMGVEKAFEWPGADFSGMDGSQLLYIGKVIHQAFVEVDEEGTEAAAATAIIGLVGSAAPSYIEFRADHPFIFLIQEKSTGSILFMGCVSDPR